MDFATGCDILSDSWSIEDDVTGSDIDFAPEFSLKDKSSVVEYSTTLKIPAPVYVKPRVNSTFYSAKHQWLRHLAISQGNVLRQNCLWFPSIDNGTKAKCKAYQKPIPWSISREEFWGSHPYFGGCWGIVNLRNSSPFGKSSNPSLAERFQMQVQFEKGTVTSCTAVEMVEILENVFLCSSVEDIPNFERVCRLWKDVLESEWFLAQQLQRAVPIELTAEHVSPNYVVVGTLNGLVVECTRDGDDLHFHIRNPATKFIFDLPSLLMIPSVGQMVINKNMSAIFVQCAFATVKLQFFLKIGGDKGWRQMSDLQFSLLSEIVCGDDFHSWSTSGTTLTICTLNTDDESVHHSSFDLSMMVQNCFVMVWRGCCALCFFDGRVVKAYVLSKDSGVYRWIGEREIILPQDFEVYSSDNLQPKEVIGNHIYFQFESIPNQGVVYDIVSQSVDSCQIFRHKYLATSRKIV